jgi:hypothetical protein
MAAAAFVTSAGAVFDWCAWSLRANVGAVPSALAVATPVELGAAVVIACL